MGELWVEKKYLNYLNLSCNAERWDYLDLLCSIMEGITAAPWCGNNKLLAAFKYSLSSLSSDDVSHCAGWLPARVGRADPADGVDLLLLHHPQHRGLRHGGREVRAGGALLQTERLSRHSYQVNYLFFYRFWRPPPRPPPSARQLKLHDMCPVVVIWTINLSFRIQGRRNGSQKEIHLLAWLKAGSGSVLKPKFRSFIGSK